MRSARASERDSRGRAARWALGLVLACAAGDAAAAELEIGSAGRAWAWSMLDGDRGDEVAGGSEATAEVAAKSTDPKWIYGGACLVVAAVAALLLRRGRA